MSKHELHPWTEADLEVAIREVRSCYEQSDCRTPECAGDSVLRRLRPRLEDAVRLERERILAALTELMVHHQVIDDHAVVTARALEQFIASALEGGTQRTEEAREPGDGMRLADFRIGREFMMAEARWRCTDVGSRVVTAIRLDHPDDPSWYNGPPYAVLESVIDEDDMLGCEPVDHQGD
jgi:hypothetical protein